MHKEGERRWCDDHSTKTIEVNIEVGSDVTPVVRDWDRLTTDWDSHFPAVWRKTL